MALLLPGSIWHGMVDQHASNPLQHEDAGKSLLRRIQPQLPEPLTSTAACRLAAAAVDVWMAAKVPSGKLGSSSMHASILYLIKAHTNHQASTF